MELACEGHPQILSVTPGMQFVQRRPSVRPEPVLTPQSDADGVGAIIYGSVIRDGGTVRMWYQAVPADWDFTHDSNWVACAESDDGLTWRRPSYGVREACGSKDNHLTDMPFHSPSVFIEPGAPAAMRYRAFGWGKPRPDLPDHPIRRRGYFTAHSADGIHWTFDPDRPVYPGHDVITSAWNPYTDRALVAMKRIGWVGGIPRRTHWTSQWTRQDATEPISALVPDEFDDVVAVARGFHSTDYYGVGLMPTPGVTIGFLWPFRHQLPLSRGVHQYGVYGRVDVSLVYQIGHRGRWRHFPGRADWLCAADLPEWGRHGISTAACPIAMGDETWLYFCAARHRHGAYLDTDWKPDPQRTRVLRETGISAIGVASWPTNRLLGFQAPLTETIELARAETSPTAPRLILNATTESDGEVRAALVDERGAEIAGYGLDDCDPLAGDLRGADVHWKGGEIPRDQAITARVRITRGTLWAFEFA